jgi:integrase
MQGHQSKHHPFLTAAELPTFFEALSQYSGSELVVLAAHLLILTGVRTGELRAARWEEFNLDGETWEIPAERMKMRLPHIVPLSKQAIAVLSRILELTRRYPLVLPGGVDTDGLVRRIKQEQSEDIHQALDMTRTDKF